MSERQRRMSPNAQERLLTILSPIAILCLWQVASWTSIIDARFVPSPLKILEASWVLIGTGELWQHLSASFFRISIGFILGVIPGIIVGMIMGLNRLARAALDPLVAAIYPIPKIAILPLLMILFGIGDGSKIAIVAIAVFFLVLINTLLGVREIDKIYLDVARNFKAPKLKFFRRVILPGAMPAIFAGLRLSLGVALIVLVAAEFVAASAGIGYLIWASWETLQIENMFVGIIVITVLGVLSTFLLKELERYLIPWKRN
jgi:ABC-type nitrate/sulfonate/bicarbonate transport system permease component